MSSESASPESVSPESVSPEPVSARAAEKRETILTWVSTGARIVLAIIFFVAGGLKAADPGQSVQAVRAYELLPTSLEQVVGWGLPFFEIALGLLLLLGMFTRTAAMTGGALMVVFIVAVFSAAVRGLSIDCGCFGGGGEVAPGQTAYVEEILRDLGFVALAVWLMIRPRTYLSLDGRLTEEIR